MRATKIEAQRDREHVHRSQEHEDIHSVPIHIHGNVRAILDVVYVYDSVSAADHHTRVGQTGQLHIVPIEFVLGVRGGDGCGGVAVREVVLHQLFQCPG